MATITVAAGSFVESVGAEKMVRGTLNLGAYASAGAAPTAAQLGLGTLRRIICDSAVFLPGSPDSARLVTVTPGTNVIRAWVASTGLEVGAVDLTTMVIPFEAFGT